MHTLRGVSINKILICYFQVHLTMKIFPIWLITNLATPVAVTVLLSL